MCLYPRLIDNRKYKSNKKNGGIIPAVSDKRVLKVPVGCGNCMECRKQKAREWQTRMLEDIKTHTNGKFITLTFSDQSIKELVELPKTKNWPGMKHLTGYELDNEIATHAVRLFNERWRKKYKRAIRHWLITELGHEGTENIHLHGILWTDKSYEDIEQIWKYGYIWPRPDDRKKTYVNGKTVNYNIKYITKVDKDHKYYKPRILTSPGIGHNYTTTTDSKYNKYKGKQTIETYETPSGHKIAMPIYWRNKIYSDEEREKLWLQRLDKQERWVNKQKIDISKGEQEYWKALKYAQQLNKELGYGNDEKNWEREQYEIERRIIKIKKRLENARNAEYKQP